MIHTRPHRGPRSSSADKSPTKMAVPATDSPSGFWQRKTAIIAALSLVAILLHLVLRFGFHATPAVSSPSIKG